MMPIKLPLPCILTVEQFPCLETGSAGTVWVSCTSASCTCRGDSAASLSVRSARGVPELPTWPSPAKCCSKSGWRAGWEGLAASTGVKVTCAWRHIEPRFSIMQASSDSASGLVTPYLNSVEGLGRSLGIIRQCSLHPDQMQSWQGQTLTEPLCQGSQQQANA